MPSEDKIARLVDKLIQQTRAGVIEWEALTVPRTLTEATDHVIKEYFECDYAGQSLGVFQRAIHSYDGDRDDFYWVDEVRLGIVSGPTLLWENPDPLASLWRLLEVARESASDIDGIVDALLK